MIKVAEAYDGIHETADVAAAMDIWNEMVRDGIAFPQVEEQTEQDADTFFTSQSHTGIAVNSETDEVVGLYILHPNNVGRCGHIANLCDTASASMA